MCDVSESTQECDTQQVLTSAPKPDSNAHNSDDISVSDTAVRDPKTYLPHDSSSKFDALMDMSIPQLKKMLKDLKSLMDGSKEQLAVRVVRHLAGLPLTPEDALLKQKQDADAAAKKKEALAARRAERVHKPISVKRAAPKKEAATAQDGTLNKAWPQRRAQRANEQAPGKPPKRMKTSLPADPGALEVFVKTYISGVDIREARLKDLYAAVDKRFGTLDDEHWNNVRDMATKIIVHMAETSSRS